jgi:DNA mismatch repair ATPase MutS
LPPVTLATSIRVQDSLEQGVSYFLAELRRLKSVVDAAHHAQIDGTRTLVFLLDEILHGTNTAERQIAARSILRHLLDLGAMGAVSTHDLQLVDTPALLSACHPFHFRETFVRGPEGPSMSFDYTLRPGIAPTTNALKLMEIVGLPAPDPALSAPTQSPP